MAEIITTLNVVPVSCKATTAVSFTRGLRGVLLSTGLYDLAGITERGQIFCDVPTAAAAGVFVGANINGSAKVPAVGSEACAVGDVAYTAASGKTSKTSTNATRIGIWSQAASGDGVLGEVIPD